MDLKTHIGLKVKSARQERGLTQEQLAAAVGRAVETVSNIERGFALTGLDTLQQIGCALGKPISFFFVGADESDKFSRSRADAEERLHRLCRTLGDDELALAVAVLETVVRERSRGSGATGAQKAR